MTAKDEKGKGAVEAIRMPNGWGFAPDVESKTQENPSGPLFKAELDSMPWMADDLLVGQIILNEVSRELELFRESGQEVHFWRAYRSVRVSGDVPPAMWKMFQKHLDALSARALEDGLRQQQREQRDWILRNYYDMVGRISEGKPCPVPASEGKAGVRRYLAKRFNTTAGAIEQMVIQYEKRSP